MTNHASFLSIDFETCRRQRASPIQIGLTPVFDGVLGQTTVHAVMPPANFREFDPGNTKIHGLSQDYIVGAPEWDEIHERLVRFSRGLPLLAHNASFERSVIVQTSDELGFAPHPFAYHCTLKMARDLDKAAPNHKLDTLAARYGIEQKAHHDAGDDSRVGALLALHLLSLPDGEAAFGAALLR